jgi:phosphoglycerate dehydrogenase-like enzyme
VSAAAGARTDALPVVLYSGPVEAHDALREAVAGRMDVVRVEPEPAAVAGALRTAAAFLDASMKVRVNAEMIAAAPALRVVAVAATGADHIDDESLGKRGIPLLTLRGQTDVLRNLTPAAELSWLLLMACARQLPAAVDHVKQGGWDRASFPGIMLRGKTLGVVGVGRIGTWMTRYATAFGMTCLGYDPHAGSWPENVERFTSLHEMLPRADFVGLHVPLTKENAGFFDRACFERMKPGAVFVNTSRGDLTDEGALLDGLRSGRIAAAGLDVLKREPDVQQHPLRVYAETHPNLVITPHIGGFSPDAVRVVVRHSAQRILQHLSGGGAA